MDVVGATEDEGFAVLIIEGMIVSDKKAFCQFLTYAKAAT